MNKAAMNIFVQVFFVCVASFIFILLGKYLGWNHYDTV